MRAIFKTRGRVVIYPASGTGAWEAALVNTLSPGDRVLMYETGQFATLWRELAERLTLTPEFISGDWRHGADPARIESVLAEDKAHAIKAVLLVHNDTSTGVTSDVLAVRQALDASGHDALLTVDTVSSLASIDPARRAPHDRLASRLGSSASSAAAEKPAGGAKLAADSPMPSAATMRNG